MARPSRARSMSSIPSIELRLVSILPLHGGDFALACWTMVLWRWRQPSRANLARAPGIVLEITHVPASAAPQQLIAEQLDLATGPFSSLQNYFLKRLLFRDDFTVIARRGHPQLRNGLDPRGIRNAWSMLKSPTQLRRPTRSIGFCVANPSHAHQVDDDAALRAAPSIS